MDPDKKSIMVTWDFTNKSFFALEHAIRISNIVKNNILLFHIVANEAEVEEAKAKMEKSVTEVKEKYGEEVSSYVHHGTIFSEISQYASEEDNNVNFVGNAWQERGPETIW